MTKSIFSLQKMTSIDLVRSRKMTMIVCWRQRFILTQRNCSAYLIPVNFSENEPFIEGRGGQRSDEEGPTNQMRQYSPSHGRESALVFRENLLSSWQCDKR